MDLKSMSEQEFDKLDKSVRLEKTRRRDNKLKEEQEYAKTLCGKYFAKLGKEEDCYYAPKGLFLTDRLLGEQISHYKEAGRRYGVKTPNWQKSVISDYISSAREWTEITKEKWNEIKEELVNFTTKDIRNNL